MLGDFFNLALRNIVQRKKRTALTILGIFIGIAAFVSLFAISRGLNDWMDDMFEKVGTDKVIIMPKGLMSSMHGPPTELKPLTDKDADFIKKIRGVKAVIGLVNQYYKVEHSGEEKMAWVMGMPYDEEPDIIPKFFGFDMAQGRDLKKGDYYDAAIGHVVSKDMFSKEVGLRKTLTIKGKTFRVAGVVEKIGSQQDDSQIYLPLKAAKEIFSIGEDLTMIIIITDRGVDPLTVAKEVRKELEDFRDQEDFDVQAYAELIEQSGQVMLGVELFFVGIASISLLVGAIGIMNTMYTSVYERTKEIGIMKAIGARNEDVLTFFMIEAGMFGLVGGVSGVIAGMGFAEMLSLGLASIPGLGLEIPVNRSPLLIFGSISFSFLIGVLSGALPARRAANLNPVDALRYE